MRRRATIGAATMALALVLAACTNNDDGGEGDADDAAIDPDRTYNLTASSYAIPGTEPYEMSEAWAERVEEMSGGRIQMEMNAGGSLIAYGDEREGLTDGVIDISINAPMFFSGDDPAFGAWGLIPAAPIVEPERARYFIHQWVHHGGGLEIARELYEPYNIYPIGTVQKSNEPLMSTVPIESLSDMQGLQVRAAPGLVADLMEAVGANPVSMAGGDIYSALDTGVVDAAEFVGAAENIGAGLHEVSDYALYPGFHSPSVNGDVTMRLDDWEEMPRDLQLILEDSVRWLNSQIDQQMGMLDVEALDRFENEFGMEVTSLSDEEMEEISALALEVTEAYRDESEMSARMIDSYLEFARTMGYIE